MTGRMFESEVFVRIVEEGSFTAAAAKLSITKSYASKLVTRLEDRLGVRLLNRSTRKLSVTEQGKVYYDRCSEIIQALEEAEELTTCLQITPRGRIRVTLPDGFGEHYLLSVMSEFKLRYPEIVPDVYFTNEYVDLVAAGIDLAVRIGSLDDSALISRKVAWTSRILCASPAYLERHGTPEHPEDLISHECIESCSYSFYTGQGQWSLDGPEGTIRVRVSGPLVTNSGTMMVNAALQGIGIVLLPEFYLFSHIESKELIHLLPDWNTKLNIQMVSPSSRHRTRKVSLLSDFLANAIRQAPGVHSED